jgi:hypothetical protein
MSTLALEIDETLQQLDAETAARLERLVRDAMALVKPAIPKPDALTLFRRLQKEVALTPEAAAAWKASVADGRRGV